MYTVLSNSHRTPIELGNRTIVEFDCAIELRVSSIAGEFSSISSIGVNYRKRSIAWESCGITRYQGVRLISMIMDEERKQQRLDRLTFTAAMVLGTSDISLGSTTVENVAKIALAVALEIERQARIIVEG